MPMRLSGLMSGMDTESIVTQLVEARKAKVTKTIKAQKSLGFKQEAWKSLNSQILKLYDGALSNLRFSSSYMKKTTKVSNSSVASVITNEGAMNSVQELEVKQLAKSAYLTGGKLELAKNAGTTSLNGDTTLSSLGFDLDPSQKGVIKIKVGSGEMKEISVTRATTINDFVGELRKAGVSANFDANNGRIYVASTSTGKENDFNIVGGDANGWKALNSLGLNAIGTDGISGIFADDRANAIEELKSLAADPHSKLAERLKENGIDLTKEPWKTDADTDAKTDWNEVLKPDTVEKIRLAVNAEIVAQREASMEEGTTTSDMETKLSQWRDKFMDIENTIASYNPEGLSGTKIAVKTEASDAKIELNGIEYTSSKNTFEINGLTITASAEGSATLTTEDDTNGIYDMIKNFFKEYNELINQMDKLYNAESASEYEPLTDEEKAEMSDSAVEQWEQKVKDSILRRDSSLNSIASAMKQVMMQGVEVNGKKMYLSNFGIETLSYFNAAENEKNAYHIDGNSDDASTSGNADKLKSMIASDPDTVIEFFTKLSQTLYGKMTDAMAGTEYSSAYTAYEDKKMKTEYDDYTAKIKELEKKLADYEDQWYAKFAAMETAMAKMQSNASAVTSLLGGS